MTEIKERRDRGQYRRGVAEDLPNHSMFGDTAFRKVQKLRYGQNPPAYEGEGGAAIYEEFGASGPSIATAQKISGEKELSFNNILDGDAGLRLCLRLHHLFPSDCIAAVIKHTGPRGVARSNTMSGAHQLAYTANAISAFGGVNVYIGTVDSETARHIASYFNEVIIAPDYTEEAKSVLRARKDLRVLRIDINQEAGNCGIDERSILGGKVAERRMISHIDGWENFEKVSSGRDPTPDELDAALFNWPVAVFAKSNGISVGSQYRTYGIGSGQGSRVDSTWLALHYANNRCQGSNSRGALLASDAFFPEPDSVRLAGEAGISAIAFPLGSVKDEESLEMAGRYGIVMLCTRPIPGTKAIERGFNH
ncbi:MAG: hypothetical protein HY517_03045 [Candidatus Aenigmarchaeota archaeon]|nr:hypothetical protein [Candidatus Aenigmarchaeota archaeon]